MAAAPMPLTARLRIGAGVRRMASRRPERHINGAAERPCRSASSNCGRAVRPMPGRQPWLRPQDVLIAMMATRRMARLPKANPHSQAAPLAGTGKRCRARLRPIRPQRNGGKTLMVRRATGSLCPARGTARRRTAAWVEIQRLLTAKGSGLRASRAKVHRLLRPAGTPSAGSVMPLTDCAGPMPAP
jgi:hypothetical protein